MKTLFLIASLVLPFLATAQLGWTEEEIRNKHPNTIFNTSHTVGNVWTKYGDIPDGSKFICGNDVLWSNTETCYYFNSNNVCEIWTFLIPSDNGSVINSWVSVLNDKFVVNSATEWTNYSGKISHTKLEYLGNYAVFTTYYDNK